MSESAPTEPSVALQSMAAALNKSLRALPRKKREAAEQRLKKFGVSGFEQFLATYRELVLVATKLEQRLEPDDPLRAEVRGALDEARRAWSELLTVEALNTPARQTVAAEPGNAELGNTEPVRQVRASVDQAQATVDAGIEATPAPEREAVQAEAEQPQAAAPVSSVALVPVKPRPVDAGPRYPDQAALVRFMHRRRDAHRWPDEAVIARYLRLRRERGPRYPDEAALARWLRERRELR